MIFKQCESQSFQGYYGFSSRAFSLLEVLFCIFILSIFGVFMLKPQIQEVIAIRQASLHLQTLQEQMNAIAYSHFLQKQTINSTILHSFLQNAQVKNKFFSFTLNQNNFVLQINNKKLQIYIEQTPNGNYFLTCNFSQDLCRKLYHRKYSK